MTTITALKDKTYDAFLFDMDGTLLDSTAVVERVWGRWAVRHGIDPAVFIPTIHGVRAVDNIAKLGLPNVDVLAEAKALELEELDDLDGVKAIEGAVAFLESLPRERWAIVTSAPIELARKRIKAAGIPFPDVIVSGEDVEKGKPNPACYMLGGKKLGVDAANCLVFEDAVAGILAGESAGADVCVISATHHKAVETAHPVISSYAGVRAEQADTGALRIVSIR